MSGGGRGLGLLVAATCAVAAGAQVPAPRTLLRPVAILDQYLYEGPFGEPRALAIDRRNGETWVADAKSGVLGVFDGDGVPLFSATPSSGVRAPSRMAVDARGRLLVVDEDHARIKVLNHRAEYVSDLALPGVGPRPRFGAVSVDAAGNVYVGENESGQVLVFTPDLRPRLRFGSRGNEEGQFQSIAGIAADAELIFVVDHQVIAVQAFDWRGNFVRGWGRHDMGIENFSLPQGVALDSRGHVIVVDALRHEVKLFDREGTLLDRFGGMGTRAGNIAYPVDVAVDAADRVWVAEKGNGRVQVFEQVEGQAPAARPRLPRGRP